MTDLSVRWEAICSHYQVQSSSIPRIGNKVYEAKKIPDRITLFFFSIIRDSVLEGVENRVLKITSGKAKTQIAILKIDPYLEGAIQVFRGRFSELLNGVKIRADIADEEVVGLAKKAEQLAGDFFKSRGDLSLCCATMTEAPRVQPGQALIALGGEYYTYNGATMKEVVVSWKKAWAEESYRYVYKDLWGNARSLEFNSTHLSSFGVSSFEGVQRPQEMSSLAFAFFETLEVRAKSMIFYGGAGGDISQSISCLSQWGYREADLPRNGDLAVYFSTENELKHVGVFTESGRVVSKFSSSRGDVYEHGVFDLPSIYGSRVIFLRRSTSDVLMTAFSFLLPSSVKSELIA